MIRTDHTNAFAHNTLRVRMPRTVHDILRRNPDYPAPIRAALEKLADDMATDAPMTMIDLPAPDYDEWAEAYAPHQGESWQGTLWFFAEIFAYRHIIQATRWWETGRDPFAPNKEEEFSGDMLWTLLDRALAAEGSREERLRALLLADLWGNRIDLSFPASLAHGGEALHEDDLLADDSWRTVEHLLGTGGPVHLVADNAGSELALDFALADALLSGVADTVTIHLKMYPTFVSDATRDDALAFLHHYIPSRGNGAAQLFAGRLAGELESRRLRLAPDLYWNSTRLLWDTPPRLSRLFEAASLVIVKGDANYRRIVGDAIWEPTTPFSQVVDYFPAPMLAMRTLKSDPIVGLQPGDYQRLDGIDPEWRVNGRRGVVQLKV
jgi:uncharacterized protein with ATP-grasp and redox domains